MTAPAITPESFPYRRKWTKAQIGEILARHERLADAMTDAVGPVGQALYLPPDMIHILALHLALAGGEVRDELAYIVSRPLPVDRNKLAFADAREWVLKQEYEPGPPDPNETAAKAKAAADQIKRQLTPEVAQALTALLAEQFNQHAPKPDTPQDIAQAQAMEADMREEES
ncbi:hypothetical protein ACEWX3_07560 [Mycobacterium sp. G7A2]|uniref:phage gene 29 protein family protein n=1 Tax=Mycobacterium sp. G7A2 TaxID=3317307 RepID=UPI0035A84A17